MSARAPQLLALLLAALILTAGAGLALTAHTTPAPAQPTLTPAPQSTPPWGITIRPAP
jgi:hypothetical protein